MLKLTSPAIKTITLCFILFFSIAVFFCCNPANAQPPANKQTTDTTIKILFRVPITDFPNKVDSLYKIIGLLGKTMTVDQSDGFKLMADRIITFLFKDNSIDSTAVPKPKK